MWWSDIYSLHATAGRTFHILKKKKTNFFRKTTARDAPLPSPSSELSLPLSTVSEPQSSSSSSSSLEEDSSYREKKTQHQISSGMLSSTVFLIHLVCWSPTPDPLADLRNLLASGATSGFFFKKDLAVTTSSPSSPSLSEEEPCREKKIGNLEIFRK